MVFCVCVCVFFFFQLLNHITYLCKICFEHHAIGLQCYALLSILCCEKQQHGTCAELCPGTSSFISWNMYGDRPGQNMQLCYGNTAVEFKVTRWWLCGNFLLLLICIKMHLKQKLVRMKMGLICVRTGTFCECSNVSLNSVKGRYCWIYSRGLCFTELCS